jgi:hypothetical protein
MKRAVPIGVWVTVVLLGLVSLIQLGVALSQSNLALLVAVAANVVIMLGLYAGHRWAYVVLLVFSAAGVVFGFTQGAGQGIGVLFFNGMICLPTVLSRDFFFGKGAPSPYNPLYCPHCGYSLLGLTEPRCPECGARFDGP